MNINLQIQDFYYLALILGGIKAFSLIYDGFFMHNAIAYKPSLKRSINKVFQTLSDKNADEIFKKVGINLSIQRYTAYRNIIMIVIIAMAFIKATQGDAKSAMKLLICSIGFYILSYPKDIFKGRKTPFKYLFDSIYATRLAKKDEELMTVVSQMKNLIISHGSVAISTDYILTRLIGFTNISKPNFIQTLALIRKGEREKAYEVFSRDFGTKLGVEFAKIMIRLDSLPASEFLEQISILQESVKEKKQTLKERKIQQKKLLVYVLASLELSVIIFNYVFIVLYDTMQMMKF